MDELNGVTDIQALTLKLELHSLRLCLRFNNVQGGNYLSVHEQIFKRRRKRNNCSSNTFKIETNALQ